MDPVVVVGSGPSGVHFAKSLLEKGRRVRMLDVGRRGAAPLRPDLDLEGLKHALPDPVPYFLGEDFESLLLPGDDEEYYGFPPSSRHVFEGLDGFDFAAHGFSPLFSFASGGLAEAWTAGCYPFSDAELADFPFGYDELAPFYARVARRIGISGTEDDLARFMPLHEGLLEPLELDEHSRVLLETYQSRRAQIQRRLGCYLGRARLASLSRDHAGRVACSYRGRCLWGCPTHSLYTPSVTLRECLADERFEYVDGVQVTHFRFSSGGRIDRVFARAVEDGRALEFDVGSLALAAGTLSSSKILLDSIQRDGGERVELGGLMDNRQVLMPFLNLRLVGRRFEPATYQYHQLAIALPSERPLDYVHGLVTTLKTALIHPVVQSVPASLGAALAVVRNIHAALGLVNINFADERRDANRVAVEPTDGGETTRLLIYYRPSASEPERLRAGTATFRRLLRRLGCVAPRAMARLRPMGASVHYAGTVPMCREGGALTADATCRSRDFQNLWFVDGTTFPSLPAKNLTFTLMANASRIAEIAF